MPRVFVKPATLPDGSPLVVRDPVTRLPIPAEGTEVELDKTIRRRLFDGDLVLVVPPAHKAPHKAPHAAEKGPDARALVVLPAPSAESVADSKVGSKP